MSFINPNYSTEYKQGELSVSTSFDVTILNEGKAHGEDSISVAKGDRSKVTIITESDNPKDWIRIGRDATGDSRFYNSSSVNVGVSDSSSVYASIADGATHSFIDNCFVTKRNPDGSLKKIPKSWEQASSVALFAQKLSSEVVKVASENRGSHPISNFKIAMKNIALNPPYVGKNIPDEQKVTATSSLVKIEGDDLNVSVICDQTAIVGFKDGSYAIFSADEAIKKFESDRKTYISEHYSGRPTPEFNGKIYEALSKEERREIERKVMEQVQRTKMGKTDGYFVAFPDANGTIDNFSNPNEPNINKNRILVAFGENSDIISLSAKTKDVKTVITSSDGFVERVLKYRVDSMEKSEKADKQKVAELKDKTIRELIAATPEKIKDFRDELVAYESSGKARPDDKSIVKIDVHQKLGLVRRRDRQRADDNTKTKDAENLEQTNKTPKQMPAPKKKAMDVYMQRRTQSR